MNPTHIVVFLENGIPVNATIAYDENEAKEIAAENSHVKTVILECDYSVRGM